MKLRASIFCFGLLALLACSPDVPPGVMDPDQKAVDDSGLELLEPKVDILFVIDNSGSMSGHQKNLAANVDNFINNFFKTIQIDFHIGVLTTDDDGGSANCCGLLVGNPSYLDRSTPDFRKILASRMIVGTSGSPQEKSFDPVFRALRVPNLNGPNAGFLRPDAFLSIVFITDAEDQSVIMTAKSLQDFLVNLKGRPDQILSYGVIVPSGEPNCDRDSSDEPKRIEQFLSFSPAAGKNEFSLCDPNFGTRVAEIGKDLAERVGSSLRLKQVPVLSTVILKFGTQVIGPDPLTGWSFDPDDNSIHIGPKIVWTKQPPGTRLKIHYEPTKFDDPK